MSILLERMKYVCTAYIGTFQDVLEIHEYVAGELLEEEVHTLLTDPSYKKVQTQSGSLVPQHPHFKKTWAFVELEGREKAARLQSMCWAYGCSFHKPTRSFIQYKRRANFDSEPFGMKIRRTKLFELHWRRALGSCEKNAHVKDFLATTFSYSVTFLAFQFAKLYISPRVDYNTKSWFISVIWLGRTNWTIFLGFKEGCIL